ncbi:MAG TPA: twitching motility protein PilT [Candidatus Ruminococcus avistercoris]|nr:twitching motility protein PilT [Candidatus Ruminococcus avistercoris]
MVQLIIGDKGEGKTKQLLDKVNEAIQEARGNIVYLDKSTKHMYELNNKIRLIDVSGFPLKNSDEFIGFICGILSQDHDLEQIYLDSFIKIARLGDEDVTDTILQLDAISEKFGVDFVISVSINENAISDALRGKVTISA